MALGSEVIGRQTGNLYAYQSHRLVPERIDPLAVQSPDTPDLFAAVGSPYPERSVHVYQLPAWVDLPAGDGQFALHTEIARANLRHTRMFLLATGGLLTALELRPLAYASGWSYPTWEFSELRSALQVSETLVYVVARRQGRTLLLATDIGAGRTSIEQSLAFEQPLVLIAGGFLFVQGEPNGTTQTVLQYRLLDYRERPSTLPVARWEIQLQPGRSQRSLRPFCLGSSFVFAAGDGKLYRWKLGGEEAPGVLWPNPAGTQLWPDPVPIGPDQIGFVAQAGPATRAADAGQPTGQSLSLLRIGGTESGELRLLPDPADLSLLLQSRSSVLTSADGLLYAATQLPGEAVEVYQIALDGRLRPAERLYTVPGTQDARVAALQAVPWQGSPRLLLQHVSRYERHFTRVNPRTGDEQLLDDHPTPEERVATLWETGGLWLVNLSEGNVRELR